MSKRVYLAVPFDRKHEAKALGARWDPGAKLWWIKEGITVPFPAIPHDYESRQNKCRGACFEQSENGYPINGCGACEPVSCPGCGSHEPQVILDCHEDHCPNCAIVKFAGGRTVKEEAKARKNSETRRCLYCSGILVAIGTSRRNGDPRKEDWEERYYHKKCWYQITKERRIM
jgi:hypothetical protein